MKRYIGFAMILMFPVSAFGFGVYLNGWKITLIIHAGILALGFWMWLGTRLMESK